MDWIAKYKWVLITLLGSSAAVLGIQLLMLREKSIEQTYIIEWGYLPLLIPTFIFTISFFPLMYFSWFKDNQQGGIKVIKQLFFWLLVMTFIIIWIGLAQRFFT